MGKKSELIRGTSKCARFFVCDTTQVVKDAQSKHGLDAIATVNFGKLLTAAAMMGKDLKVEDGVVSVEISGDGAYGKMVATANMKGHVKGYVGNSSNAKLIDKDGNFVRDEKGRIKLIGDGIMQVRKDIGLKMPFSGMVALENQDIADIVASYFLQSEQIKSVVALGVKLNEDGSVNRAGGYLIQLLPGVEDTFIDKLEDKLKQIRSITELLNGGFSLERIVELLYEDISVFEETEDVDGNHKKKYVENFEILEKSEIEYKCNCSRETFLKGLITLGKEQIDEIFKEQGKIEVECHFCGKKHQFEKKILKEHFNLK
ncbi:Hsp33 family molecular chaperone HslO [Leptotrichia sp. oral taxon 218]|uniref:Hsp33 family molecular chaperone HslO n=1 Tax=Leptotrichia sp. oral taxon 218 TaxID=712361 RepID=UPI001B8CD2EB|nr:Hsp33 family molecular chaperone HslO [Leptotrichia sp. oral taxon 218]QUB95373.1 Hsp33 family molecular chaperone HslO [Leptotrichia sp. oral taxon 218]